MKKLQIVFAKSTIIILVFLSQIYSQTTIENQQFVVDTRVWSATTPNTPSSYIWQEIINIKQGVQISVTPKKRAKIYLQQNNSWLNFHTFNWT